ncbi:DUF2231 domain-containing protein [Saccharothrix texasensis]|uniref:Putative membrane protein n=1 Tax=Saccharothrix texasensis TaxID=103734 RepID=A0A3N1HHE0_9PSEU|nr:DUF2231 domain-containing protein [Saccharothrix texasensis]ROP41920.1 putative membrane protein [Saccharothrix texasensis]
MHHRVQIARCAAQPILVISPPGLLTTAVGFDLLRILTHRTEFDVTAAHLIAAGVVMGVLSTAAAWIEWSVSTPPRSPVRQVGRLQALTNVVMLTLFASSWLLRAEQPAWQATGPALALACTGVLVGAIGGWLGGELVERLGAAEHSRTNLPKPVMKPAFRG